MSKSEMYNRNGRSYFGPLILIGVGVFFLMRNLGTLPHANWVALIQLWPLALVFAGLNLVVQRAPRPVGGLLSTLVGVTAVFTAAYILFFSEDNALLHRLGVRTSPTELNSENISFQPNDISKAEVELKFGISGGEVFALQPNEGLLQGNIAYVGDLIFETKENDGEATILLDTKHSGPWQWFDHDYESNGWQIGLSPRVPLDLRIDSGVGVLALNLDQLTLSYLDIDLGTGSSTITLPEGQYDINLDAGVGSINVLFPDNGRISADINGGTGSFNIVIPDGIPARVEISSGLGSTNLDNRFTLIEGDRNDDGIWQTDDYESGTGRGLDLFIDVGTGSVRVEQDN